MRSAVSQLTEERAGRPVEVAAATSAGDGLHRTPPGCATWLPSAADTAQGDDPVRDLQHPLLWGFADSRFLMHPDRVVEMVGSRYTTSGQRLPHLVPWVEKVIGISIDPEDVRPEVAPPPLPPSALPVAAQAALQALCGADNVLLDETARRRNGHGHTQQEIFQGRYGEAGRMPDAVVRPRSQVEVEGVVSLAREHGLCLIPYGGGTSVTQALRCPTDEPRPIVSVDLHHLRRLVWIDPVNRLACIEAGARGRHISQTLAAYGFTMGHEPDSIEFSTLGGWVATWASGMKKNRYGNIEDIVVGMTAVTAQGTLEENTLVPRRSCGVEVGRLMLGSEGGLGIVTRVVVRLVPLPEVQTYGSVIFPTFAAGLEFCYALSQEESVPASVRLVDNLQFQFGQALKPESGPLRALQGQLQRALVTGLRGFDPEQMVACTLVYEGSDETVRRQRQRVLQLARRLRGMQGGPEHGRRGYQLTYGIAYIRDFVMRHHIIAESFETSVPWSCVTSLIERVRRRILREHQARRLPGRPVLMSRVTQLYRTGACVYFYLALYLKGVARPDETYHAIECAARDEILQAGGSLSHHHGIGKLRAPYIPEIRSPTARLWLQKSKEAIDPDNIFGCGNQGFGPQAAT